MRIAFVAPLISPLREPHVGGVATLLTDLAAAIQAEGHEVTVFAASGSEVEGLRIVDTGVSSPDLAGTRFRPAAPAQDRQPPEAAAVAQEAFGRVYELVGAESFDVVHNHSFDAPAISLAAGVPWPVVHTLHLPPEPGVSRAIARAQAGPRPPVVATVSTSQLRSWRRYNHVDLLLGAGIPTSRIPWSEDHEPRLLLAGRISPEKGVLDAVEIARRTGMPLTIAGHRYDEGYAAEVDRVVADEPGITCAGSLKRRELWEEMNRAAVLLFPIRWDEPFGLVAAEAQAAGCPVVGYRRGALPDLIAEGVTGIAVREGDIGAAVAAVEQALAFDRLSCRLHAEKHLDLAASVDAHLRLYRRLAG